MTPTEVLRRLLDERGIMWVAISEGATEYAKEGVVYRAYEVCGGLQVEILTLVTPEQAIAATIDRTCKQEEQGWSTEGDHARVWLACGHDCMVSTVADLPNFCPEYGAKVMD